MAVRFNDMGNAMPVAGRRRAAGSGIFRDKLGMSGAFKTQGPTRGGRPVGVQDGMGAKPAPVGMQNPSLANMLKNPNLAGLLGRSMLGGAGQQSGRVEFPTNAGAIARIPPNLTQLTGKEGGFSSRQPLTLPPVSPRQSYGTLGQNEWGQITGQLQGLPQQVQQQGRRMLPGQEPGWYRRRGRAPSMFGNPGFGR